MMTISVIIGSTRQGRFSEKPAQWILQQLRKRGTSEARLLDLRDFPMPFFDQPTPPAMPGRSPYALGTFPGWGRRQGPRRTGQASQRYDRRPALVGSSSQGGPRALIWGKHENV